MGSSFSIIVLPFGPKGSSGTSYLHKNLQRFTSVFEQLKGPKDSDEVSQLKERKQKLREMENCFGPKILKIFLKKIILKSHCVLFANMIPIESQLAPLPTKASSSKKNESPLVSESLKEPSLFPSVFLKFLKAIQGFPVLMEKAEKTRRKKGFDDEIAVCPQPETLRVFRENKKGPKNSMRKAKSPPKSSDFGGSSGPSHRIYSETRDFNDSRFTIEGNSKEEVDYLRKRLNEKQELIRSLEEKYIGEVERNYSSKSDVDQYKELLGYFRDSQSQVLELREKVNFLEQKISFLSFELNQKEEAIRELSHSLQEKEKGSQINLEVLAELEETGALSREKDSMISKMKIRIHSLEQELQVAVEDCKEMRRVMPHIDSSWKRVPEEEPGDVSLIPKLFEEFSFPEEVASKLEFIERRMTQSILQGRKMEELLLEIYSSHPEPIPKAKNRIFSLLLSKVSCLS